MRQVCKSLAKLRPIISVKPIFSSENKFVRPITFNENICQRTPFSTATPGSFSQKELGNILFSLKKCWRPWKKFDVNEQTDDNDTLHKQQVMDEQNHLLAKKRIKYLLTFEPSKLIFDDIKDNGKFLNKMCLLDWTKYMDKDYAQDYIATFVIMERNSYFNKYLLDNFFRSHKDKSESEKMDLCKMLEKTYPTLFSNVFGCI